MKRVRRAIRRRIHAVRAPTRPKRTRCTLGAMRFRAAPLAALAVAIAAAGVSGCRRHPLGGMSGDTSLPDARAADVSEPGDAADSGAPPDDVSGDGPAPVDASGAEAPVPDSAGGDARGDGRADGSSVEAVDGRADTAADAPADTAADAPADTAVDAPLDASVDAPADAVAADRAAADRTSDARPEDQPCGALGWNCAPFACDVARGQCKTVCASNDDCMTGRPCVGGSCGRYLVVPCAANNECASGYCAQGVCCETACNEACRSCALPGSVGVCTFVPSENLDPIGVCPRTTVCNGSGQCVGPACGIDTDCGDAAWCTNGRCAPCRATCASNADCTATAVCVMRNFCTYCTPADAGAG
jgi:hypothetical protein